MEAQVNSAGSAGKWSPSSQASDIVKSIHAMLHPRNIVLVGATDKPGNYAERIWNNLIKLSQMRSALLPACRWCRPHDVARMSIAWMLLDVSLACDEGDHLRRARAV